MFKEKLCKTLHLKDIKDFNIKYYYTKYPEWNKEYPVDVMFNDIEPFKYSQPLKLLGYDKEILSLAKKISGKIVLESQKCGVCNGEMTIFKRTNLKYRVPKNAHKLDKIMLKGAGNEGIGNIENGDVFIEFDLENDEKFTLRGDDLVCNEVISFPFSVLGGDIRVQVFNKTLTVSLPKKSSGKNYRIKGEGLNGGALIIYVEIKTPNFEDLSQEEINLLLRLNEYDNFR